MLVLSLTLVGSLTAFGAAVIRRGGYFYNSNGLMACEPFYQRPSLRILAACLYYFPTTMALMYFYGSALHVDRLRHRQQINICAVLVQPMLPNNAGKVYLLYYIIIKKQFVLMYNNVVLMFNIEF